MQSQNPLRWPAGRPRTERKKHSSFGPGSLTHALSHLEAEIRRVRGDSAVLTLNVKLGVMGQPLASVREPDDNGVAIYFQRGDQALCLACDLWGHWRENVHAIVKHIQAMRGMERWGVGNLAQAFLGYKALPPAPCPFETLGIPKHTSGGNLRHAWRMFQMQHHPDRGGDAERFKEGVRAYEEISGTAPDTQEA